MTKSKLKFYCFSILTLLPYLGRCEENLFTQSMLPASAWQLFSEENSMTRNSLLDAYIADCEKFAAENKKIPKQDANQLRISSYNVHLWCKPKVDFHHVKKTDIDENFYQIVKVIQKIDAKVIMLQEVIIFDWQQIKEAFAAINYDVKEDAFIQTSTNAGYPYGNMILVKHGLAHTVETKLFTPLHQSSETRGYVKVTLNLPHEQKLHLYGTHLACHDNDDAQRYHQVQELINEMNRQSGPSLVAGDFNAVRSSDYQYQVNGQLVWNLLNKDYEARHQCRAPTKALNLFGTYGFMDCFSKNKQASPKFTTWNGTCIDFIWLHPSWPYTIGGSYLYYDANSDHLPILFDLIL